MHIGRTVFAYALLAYALSWAWEVPLLFAGATVGPGTGWPTHFPALAGPAIAALIVASATVGLRRIGRALVRVRVAPRWWLVALSPVVMFAVAMGWVLLSGDALPPLASFAVFSGLPSAWGVVAVITAVVMVQAVVLIGLELRARHRGLPSVLGPTQHRHPTRPGALRAG